MLTLILGILIGFSSIFLSIVFYDKIEKHIEEYKEKLLFFIIAVVMIFIGFRTNELIISQFNKIGEISPDTILYLFKNIVSSGLLLVLILLIIGWITRWCYSTSSKLLNVKECELKEEDIKIIFVFATLTCILFYIAVDGFESMTYFYVFAILLGKEIWIDTTKEDLRKLYESLIEVNLKRTIKGVILLFIIGVLVVRPIHLDPTIIKLIVGIMIGLISSVVLLLRITLEKTKDSSN